MHIDSTTLKNLVKRQNESLARAIFMVKEFASEDNMQKSVTHNYTALISLLVNMQNDLEPHLTDPIVIK